MLLVMDIRGSRSTVVWVLGSISENRVATAATTSAAPLRRWRILRWAASNQQLFSLCEFSHIQFLLGLMLADMGVGARESSMWLEPWAVAETIPFT